METRISYDVNGRVRLRTEAAGRPEERSTETVYDGAGRPTTMTYHGKNSSGQPEVLVTSQGYDTLGRRTAVSGARTLVQSWEYDANDNAVSQIDGRGIRNQVIYDGQNRRTSMTAAMGRPEAGTVTMGYDLVGNVLWQQDAIGRRRYTYHDALHRPTHESLPVAAGQRLAVGWWNNPAQVLR